MVNPEQRYVDDLEFRHLVDALEQLLATTKLTVEQMHDAVVLANIHHQDE